jgi:hypothetical protein
MTSSRERMPERLEAFVDAAFAFAVTLLILWNNELPDSIGSLLDLLKTIPSSAASFTLIAVYGWYTAAGIFALFCLAVLVLAGVTNSVILFLTTSSYFLAFFNGLVQARARKTAGRVFDADSAADPPITGATETAEEE